MEPIFEEAVGHQVDTLFAGYFHLLLGSILSMGSSSCLDAGCGARIEVSGFNVPDRRS
jgi:hypothetical protein